MMAKGLAWVVMFLATIVVHANGEVPVIFILGDSTADVGTNNFLPGSNARANFPHNGIDFPHGIPTGRFSNGLNTADFLAKLLGHKRSPLPYLSLNGTSSLKKHSFRGINFASGGSGLLDITGETMSTLTRVGKDKKPNGVSETNKQKNVISMTEQVYQFIRAYNDLLSIKGRVETAKFMSNSLVFISTGSNDILGYYYSNSTIPKQDFISTLGLAYKKHLKNLLSLGARKFGIVSVPSIGCCPSQRIQNATLGCLEDLNDLARAFYSTMESLMCKLNSEYKDMKYSLGNSYEMSINVIDNPKPFKFKDIKAACCGHGVLNAQSFCDPTANFCANRREFLFWDRFHPTQAASQLAAITLYSGGPRFVTPINFSELATA